MGALGFDARDGKGTAIERAFAEASDQLAEIRSQLLETAPRTSESVVDDWVLELIRRELLKMRGSLEAKRQQAASQLTGFEGERPTDRQGRYQAFFAAIDPRLLGEEFDSGPLARSIWSVYKHSLSEFRRKSFYGRLLGRYELPENVVKLLVEQAVDCVDDARTAFADHNRQYRASAEFMASLVAGTVDPGQQLERSMRQAHKTFEQACDAIVSVRQRVEINLRLVLMTLYVGGVVRFARDLTAMGRELMSIDFEKADLRVEMRSAQKAAFHDWCASARKELDELEKDRKWAELATVASRALTFVTADPARRNEVSDDASKSYAVLFARARCRALMRAGDAAWKRGDIVVAATLYRTLIEGTNLAWERGNGRTPKPESIARAGMRLALACTSTAGRRVPNAESIVPALVAYVQQALVRLESKASEDNVSSEALDPHTVRCARVLAAFCAHEKIPVVPPLGLRAALQNQVEKLGWKPESVTPLMSEVGSWAKGLGGSQVRDSKLLSWLSSTVTQRRRRRTGKWLKVTAGVVAFSGFVWWVGGELSVWQERYLPTRLHGNVAPPVLVEPGPAWTVLMSELTPLERVEIAEKMWENASKETLLSQGQLDHVKAHLGSVPAGTTAAERAARLLSKMEGPYASARAKFASEAKLEFMGDDCVMRALGARGRQFRVNSSECDENQPKKILEELRAELQRLDFSEVECHRTGKGGSWTQPL